MRSLSPRLATVGLLLAGAVTAQDKADQAVNINSRVSRALKSLLAVPSFEMTTTLKAKASKLQRQMGRGKTTKSKITTVREGDLMCWSKDSGDQVLATKGGRWVLLDRDGEWIPARRPQGTAWKDQFLPDPAFLAGRLLHQLKGTTWKAAGSDTIGDKAVRVYKAKVELDEANHLVRTGALPQGSAGSMAGMVQRIVIIGGAGGRMALPEPEREFEISIYEDPGTKMPVRIVVKCFTEEAAGGIGGIVVRGGFGQDDEEEEEEEEEKDKVKKPSLTVTMEIGGIGESKATDLTAKARKILDGR